MKKYAFFDIDNTIYTTKLNKIDETIPLLFQRLIKKGYKIGIATGRGLSAIDCINSLSRYISYYVLANGMAVYNNSLEVIYENYFTDLEFEKIYDIAQKNDVAMGVDLKIIRGYINNPKTKFPLRGDIIISKDYLKDNKVQAIWFSSNSDRKIKSAYNALKNEKGITPFLWNKGGIDISRFTDKKTGIEKIIDPKDYLIYVGDGANDLCALKIANLKIAMKTSSCEELLKIADYKVASSNSSGIYNLFEKLNII